MNVHDIRGFPARQRRRLTKGLTKVWKGEIANGGIEPVAERHAGAARGGLGPLPDGWIDALNTPRQARIHAFVRFRIRRDTCASSLPARPWWGRQSNSAQAVCHWHRLFRVRVKNGLKNQSAGVESYAIGEIDGWASGLPPVAPASCRNG